MDDSKYSLDILHERSYRDLQKLAKSFKLPCNVKKIYLVQLIHAKKFQSASEVDSIVQQVKIERQRQSQQRNISTRKKKELQAPDISSTNSLVSPAIVSTPKRPRYPRVQYSPDERIRHTSYQTQSLLKPSVRRQKLSLSDLRNSDRVLRSCNQRLTFGLKHINSENSILKVIKTQNSVTTRPVTHTITSNSRNEKISIIHSNTGHPKVNITKCLVQKQKAHIQCSRSRMLTDKTRIQIIPVVNKMSQTSQTKIPLKYPSLVSGIHPILDKQTPNVNFEYIQSLGFRRNDGTISKINALVLKNKKIKSQNYCRNIEMTMQDLIESNINSHKRAISNISVMPRTNFRLAGTTSRIQREITYLNSVRESSTSREEMHLDVTTEVSPKRTEIETTYSHTHQEVVSSSQKEVIYSDIENEPQTNYNIINEPQTNYENNISIPIENEMFNRSLYYNKNIQTAGQSRQRNSEQSLPRINEVFTKFNDATQPLFIQVSDESERTINYPTYTGGNISNTSLLESLFNFKTQFMVNQPLLQIATTANTKCVYSAATVTTAKEQATGPECMTHLCEQASQNRPEREVYSNKRTLQENTINTNDPMDSFNCDYAIAACERPSQSCDDLNVPDSNQLFGDNLDTSEATVSFDWKNELNNISPDRSSQATIPEMVEDALEYISQDGDYVQQLGMDVRMQCILCSWAGPRFILDHHIRTTHPNQIIKQDKSEWNITFTLGNLVQQQHWFSQVVDYESELYILSAKYEDPEFLLTSFNTLSTDLTTKTGTVTIYNKVTGEPHIWSGEVQILPTSLPYYTDAVCLKLEISSLNLLPNSANLQLINRELVMKSPSKVFVGHPELNDIHIIVFVKIFN